MVTMSLDAHIQALKTKHQDLEAKIQEENSRPLPDEDLIAGLKREKLKIKDELAEHSL